MANPNNKFYGVDKLLPTLPSEGIIDPSNEQLGLLILKTVMQVNAHRKGPLSPWVWKGAAERLWADGEHSLKGKYTPWSDARKARNMKSRVLKLISHYSTPDMPCPPQIKLLAHKLGTKMEEYKACCKRHQSEGPKPLLGHGVTFPTTQNVALENRLKEAPARLLAPIYETVPPVASKTVTNAEEGKAVVVRGAVADADGGRLKSKAATVVSAARGPSWKENNGQQPHCKKGNTGTLTASKSAVNRANQASLPPVVFHPILERISLPAIAVSLTPMSGNEVVRHIRNKADEVITRFLPCVGFLVNCQKELWQGLALAQQQQQQQQLMDEHSRDNAVMTPRQFHTLYIVPLPYRFKRRYEHLMANDHLRHAVSSLESLVRDSAAAVPKDHERVMKAFLGGIRENQSWGLRKWLSEHGGAGSICDDVEDVMRYITSLKEEESTKRLAEMLRPIAREALERLKKDVPAAYQKKSKAHPYLPFFHRLESCLKQMTWRG